jgi:hypothetical protein
MDILKRGPGRPRKADTDVSRETLLTVPVQKGPLRIILRSTDPLAAIVVTKILDAAAGDVVMLTDKEWNAYRNSIEVIG